MNKYRDKVFEFVNEIFYYQDWNKENWYELRYVNLYRKYYTREVAVDNISILKIKGYCRIDQIKDVMEEEI